MCAHGTSKEFDPGSISEPLQAASLVMANIGNVVEGSSFNLTASVTRNGNEIVSYLWQQTGGPAATIANATHLSTSVSNAPVGTLTFSLTITDALGRESTDNLTVVVTKKTTTETSSGGGGGGSFGLLLLFLIATVKYRKISLSFI